MSVEVMAWLAGASVLVSLVPYVLMAIATHRLPKRVNIRNIREIHRKLEAA